MDTRESIIELADRFIREQGYNAFSYKDISNAVGIRTASIHYHFPAKADLGVSVIKMHQSRFEITIMELAGKKPKDRLQYFLDNYSAINAENKVCLVGSLATAFNTLDEPIQRELTIFADAILSWVTQVLAEGKAQGKFHFDMPPRTKAIMIIGNMLSIVQLARLTGSEDVDLVKRTIITDLTKQKK